MPVYLDSKLEELVAKKGPNVLVPWFLCTSILYYYHDVSVISDSAFDEMCRQLDQRWNEIDHPDKKFISRDDLKAGTGFYLTPAQLPDKVLSAAKVMHKDYLASCQPTED